MEEEEMVGMGREVDYKVRGVERAKTLGDEKI